MPHSELEVDHFSDTLNAFHKAEDEDELSQIFYSFLRTIPFTCLFFNVSENSVDLIRVFNDQTIPGPLNQFYQIKLFSRIDLNSNLIGKRVLIIDRSQNEDILDEINTISKLNKIKSLFLIPVRKKDRIEKCILFVINDNQDVENEFLQQLITLIESYSVHREKLIISRENFRKNLETDAIEKIAREIETNSDQKSIFKIVHQQIIHVWGPDIGFAVVLYRPERGELHIPYLYENFSTDEVNSLPFGGNLSSHVISTKKPLLIERNFIDRVRELGIPFIPTPAKSWLGVPLILGNKCFGAFVLQDQENEESFKNDDVKFLAKLAPFLAMIVQNKNYETKVINILKQNETDNAVLNAILTKFPDSISIAEVTIDQNNQDISSPLIDGISLSELDRDLSDLELGQPDQNDTKVYQDTDGKWCQDIEIPVYDQNGENIALVNIKKDITSTRVLEDFYQQTNQFYELLKKIHDVFIDDLPFETVLQKLFDHTDSLFPGKFSLGYYSFDTDTNNLMKFTFDDLGENLKPKWQETNQKNHFMNEFLIGNQFTDKHIVKIQSEGTENEIAIPLIQNKELLGILIVTKLNQEAFLDDEIIQFSTLANFLAFKVNNTRNDINTKEIQTKTRFISQVINLLLEPGDNVTDKISSVLEKLGEELIYEKSAILILNSEGKLQISISNGYVDQPALDEIDVGEGAIGLSALMKTPFIVNNCESDSKAIPLDEKTQSQISAPITINGSLYGVLVIENNSKAVFKDLDKLVVAAIANLMGIVTNNQQILKKKNLMQQRNIQLTHITEKMRKSIDRDEIIRIAVTEACKSLNAQRALLRIQSDDIKNNTSETTIDLRANK